MQNSERIPVIIIGAGPAGLTAALFLARQGVEARVFERHAGTAIHPRARGLNVRTMEIYRGVGLEPAIRDAGAALAASRYMLFVETLAGQEIRRVPDDDIVLTGDALAIYTPCSWVQCAQDELEPLVLNRAQSLGARIEFGMECLSLTQDDDGVQVEVRDVTSGERRYVQALYVLVADGAKGRTREQVGIPLIERAVQGHYVNIYFRADLRPLVQGREFALCFVESPEAPGIILAVNNSDRWLFNAEYDPATTSLDAFTIERCIELVRAAVGLPDLPVEVLSVLPWDATARYAAQMQHGRVFLMGDAAHTMLPAGGLGLNTGVADAHNLAWKLALVLQGQASPALLATYEAERQPLARQIVEHAVRELEAERPDAPPENGLEEVLVPVLGFSYESSAVIPDGFQPRERLDLTGRPGTRLPHVWLERRGERISTLDLIDDHFVLLTGPEGGDWQPIAQRTAEQLHLSITIYQIGGEEIRDPSGQWCGRNGIGRAGALLVRPDGVVAWRAERMMHNLDEVFMRILGRA